MLSTTREQINKLAPFVSIHKQEIIARVLENRTRKLTVVLEDIYHPQNASAAIRTCECLGIQDIHIIEDNNVFTTSPRVVHGSSKWITQYQYAHDMKPSPTHCCLKYLKENGYRVYATSLEPAATAIGDLDQSEKMAFVFGNEISGVSHRVLQEADMLVKVPMLGFTDSLNLSVSVGMILHHTIGLYRKHFDHWGLSEGEKDELMLDWFGKIVRGSDLILKL